MRVTCGIAAIAAAQLSHPPNYAMLFRNFKNDYSKTYNGDEEEALRFKIFKDNVDLIHEHNSKGASYELGVNQFADLTLEEFSQTYLGYKAPSKPFGGAAYLGQHVYNGEALPTSVDWSAQGAVTPIKNQGQCGSCWSFSTTGSLEGASEIATGRLTSLSEQQFVDCAGSYGNQGCNGGLMDDAFKYAESSALCTEESYPYILDDGIFGGGQRNRDWTVDKFVKQQFVDCAGSYGNQGCNGGLMDDAFKYAESSALCTEESYPYKGTGGSCNAGSCTAGLAKGSVSGYKDVKANSENDLASAVAQQPVSIAIEANLPAFQLYSSGVLTGVCGASLDHGVLAVGYGTMGGTQYWKVKNSWGATWGMSGYVLLEKGKGGAGECGLLKQPSYPVVAGSSVVV
eukprot:CAMPEP_0204303870 /NCGR_PEP_ID=MMETSP0468-20130131/84125_1 /ASSEMBLY_ACC=CAM_ASM_000383 /TAXON_ID=2969 /ORGANISM="Oxyrrhis marina" /LENGTH=398 /DNA_ID=CAMNT_0051283189 /DNA_START=62 /DNA_END=1259 /DNA_ORIENTATION=+